MREFLRRWLGIDHVHTPDKPVVKCSCIQHEDTCTLFVPPPPPRFKRGDRVRVIMGFNVGAVGTIEFQEPAGDRCWMIRDRADGPLWWMNFELEPYEDDHEKT